MVKVLFFVALLSIAVYGQFSFDTTVVCMNYDSNAPMCSNSTMEMSSTSFKMIMKYAKCPSGTVCGSDGSLTGTKCNSLISNGAACNSSSQCSSKYCNNQICADSPKEGAACSTNDKMLGQYYCKSGIVTKFASMGSDCSTTSSSTSAYCYNSACNPNTNKCDKYVNVLKTKDFSKLIGADADGYKKCTTATVDTDCKYMKGTTEYTAKALNFGCIPTTMSTSVEYTCQFGGGEAIIESAIAKVS